MSREYSVRRWARARAPRRRAPLRLARLARRRLGGVRARALRPAAAARRAPSRRAHALGTPSPSPSSTRSSASSRAFFCGSAARAEDSRRVFVGRGCFVSSVFFLPCSERYLGRRDGARQVARRRLRRRIRRRPERRPASPAPWARCQVVRDGRRAMSPARALHEQPPGTSGRPTGSTASPRITRARPRARGPSATRRPRRERAVLLSESSGSDPAGPPPPPPAAPLRRTPRRVRAGLGGAERARPRRGAAPDQSRSDRRFRRRARVRLRAALAPVARRLEATHSQPTR